VEWTGAGNVVFPTRPAGTSDDTPANTQFVTNAANTIASTVGFVALNTLTASGSTTLVDATSLSKPYDTFFITFTQLGCSVNTTNLAIRVSTDGGTSFIATSYLSVISGVGIAGGSALASGFVSYVQPNLNPVNATTGAIGVNGYAYLYTPAAPNISKPFLGQMSYIAAANNTFQISQFTGFWNGTTAINTLEFAFATSNTVTGTISTGTIKIFGVS
jgi:hypothetical protein